MFGLFWSFLVCPNELRINEGEYTSVFVFVLVLPNEFATWNRIHHKLAESQKPPGLPSIGAWRGGTYTYPKWPHMQNIYVKFTWNIHIYAGGTYVVRMWSVCAAQVKTYVSRMWNICKTYVKHMRSTCDTVTYFGTGLRCVYVLLMYTFANLCLFNVGGK